MQTAQPRGASLLTRAAADRQSPQPRAPPGNSAFAAFPSTGLPQRDDATTAVRPGSSPGRRSRRPVKKRPAVQIEDEPVPSGRSREGKMLKLALARSLVETKLAKTVQVPLARVFYPTKEEFANPIKYIASIRHEAEKTGVCKIVPPKGWKPTFAIDLDNPNVRFDTRLQRIHELQQGRDYGDGREHTFRSFQASADAFRRKWLLSRGMDPNTVTSQQIEEEYWRIVETGMPDVEVEYANDLDISVVGSGFPRAENPFLTLPKGGDEVIDFDDPEYYRNTAWNLNNLPYAYGSLLRHVHTAIKGINIPWLYCGMLFASFCWHTEDNYMYSVNYQHIGAKKRWYGVPSSSCERFEETLRSHVPERFRESPDLLLHLTTMISPTVLKANGVEVFTIVQEPGDIILTFPKGYHAGFSEGFNCNEAVNFVLPDWIQYSRECIEMYRVHARDSIFSHDRFIFHFGSTQNLDEYSVEDCEMLLRELRYMFHEEQHFKKEFAAAGLENVLELSGDVMMDDQSMSVDDVRVCFQCRHNLFFSGVVCECKPTRMSCLRHARDMCKCPMKSRTLLQWISSAELKYSIRRVQQKTRAIRQLQSGSTHEPSPSPKVP